MASKSWMNQIRMEKDKYVKKKKTWHGCSNDCDKSD